ncbi:MAG: VCBS repeat-containing protein [Planctomycetes bacterium]|nr:VCBS repeat-containing protein [Planctomycetota bacterium]
MLNWPVRADHGVSVVVDPRGREIWNVRHHTINVFDARTGRLLHRHEFRVRGKGRRNYGPVLAARAGEAESLLAVMSQRVEHHLCCFRREASGSFSRLFERFFGYVYAPADHGACVAYTPTGLGDVDGDGRPDVVYSARTAQPKPETRTVICDLSTGRERVIPQTWLAGLVDLDGDGKKELLAYEDVAAEMPDRGTLLVFRITSSGAVNRLGRVEGVRLLMRPLSPVEQPQDAAWSNVELWAPAVLTGPEGAAVLIRRLGSGRTRLLKLEGDELRSSPAPSVLDQGEVLAVGQWTKSGPHLVVIQTAAGWLQLAALPGDVRFKLPLRGGVAALSSAVDLNGDGRCELVTRCPDRRLRVHRIDDSGQAKLVWSAPFEAQTSRLSPLARDLTGDGVPEIVGFGRTADGALSVRCHGHDGRILWETPLPMPSSSKIVKWIAGDFRGRGRSGVFVSVQQDLAREASFLLDGRDGRIVWQGPTANTPGGVRCCNPVGIPTAFDFNGDGWDDVLLDYRDYVALLNGRDGSFLQSPISLPPVPAGWKVAYSSFTPVRASARMRPHFLLPLGHGGIGLLGPDLRTEVWFHKPYYDTPQKVGLIDVDGDGRLEVGYEERRDGWFVCRDLWTGQEEWRIKLPGAGYGACITADFDGDGRGEFLIGDCCIGTDAEGRGQLRWRASHWAPYPLVADLDGDGGGELILPGSDGRLRVLKARPRER